MVWPHGEELNRACPILTSYTRICQTIIKYFRHHLGCCYVRLTKDESMRRRLLDKEVLIFQTRTQQPRPPLLHVQAIITEMINFSLSLSPLVMLGLLQPLYRRILLLPLRFSFVIFILI